MGHIYKGRFLIYETRVLDNENQVHYFDFTRFFFSIILNWLTSLSAVFDLVWWEVPERKRDRRFYGWDFRRASYKVRRGYTAHRRKWKLFRVGRKYGNFFFSLNKQSNLQRKFPADLSGWCFPWNWGDRTACWYNRLKFTHQSWFCDEIGNTRDSEWRLVFFCLKLSTNTCLFLHTNTRTQCFV